MSLQDEIDVKSKEIHTDGYPMSIGELTTIYRDGEMNIHPEFQRFFRWTELQKTKLIESILLGIPIPSIFVSQREDGIWDVIDGLQRLSTIFEFIGELKDEQGNKKTPSTLLGTQYLPSLKNKQWENDSLDNSFTPAQRLLLKRAKLDIKIIKKESDADTKYELFQRLNTGGTPLSLQEIRNCLLIMVNPAFYKWLRELSEFPQFKDCLILSDRANDEQYDLELALRFFVYKNSTIEEIKETKDIGELITDKMLSFAKDQSFDYKSEADIFKSTFSMIYESAGEEAFKKYDRHQDRFLGGFSISAYEVIATGISKNINQYVQQPSIVDTIRTKIKSLWENPIFKSKSGSGTRASTRLPHFMPLAENHFKNEN